MFAAFLSDSMFKVSAHPRSKRWLSVIFLEEIWNHKHSQQISDLPKIRPVILDVIRASTRGKVSVNIEQNKIIPARQHLRPSFAARNIQESVFATEKAAWLRCSRWPTYAQPLGDKLVRGIGSIGGNHRRHNKYRTAPMQPLPRESPTPHEHHDAETNTEPRH